MKFTFENLISHDEIIPEESGTKIIKYIIKIEIFLLNYLTFPSTSSIIKKYLTNKEKLKSVNWTWLWMCCKSYLKKFDIESYTYRS